MFWHIETDIICLVIIFALFMGMRKKDNTFSRQDSLFTIITVVSMFCIVIDVIASIVMEESISIKLSRGLYQFTMIIYFISLPLLPVLWFYYAALTSFQNVGKKFYIFMLICLAPCIAFQLAVLTNPWTGVIFTLTNEMVYERGPLFISTVFAYILYTVMTFLVLVVRFKYIMPRSKVGLILMCPLIVSICIAVQLSTNIGLLLINAGYTISFVITYTYIEDRRFSLDGLTKVLVRGSGEKKINEMLKACEPNSHAAMILMDIDNFKTVNDTLGHLAGDEVLKSIATITKSVINKNSLISRFGGDEFLVFTTDFGTMDRFMAKIDIFFSRISNDMNYGVNIRPEKPVTVSLGIAIYNEHGLDFVTLYKHADMALQIAKTEGKNTYKFYSPEMDDAVSTEIKAAEDATATEQV